MVDARRLEAISKAIGGAEGQVRHAPVPENDRMTQRYRNEGDTLVALVEKDKVLVGQAETLRSMVAAHTADDMLSAASDLEAGISAILQTLAERRVITM